MCSITRRRRWHNRQLRRVRTALTREGASAPFLLRSPDAAQSVFSEKRDTKVEEAAGTRGDLVASSFVHGAAAGAFEVWLSPEVMAPIVTPAAEDPPARIFGGKESRTKGRCPSRGQGRGPPVFWFPRLPRAEPLGFVVPPKDLLCNFPTLALATPALAGSRVA